MTLEAYPEAAATPMKRPIEREAIDGDN